MLVRRKPSGNTDHVENGILLVNPPLCSHIIRESMDEEFRRSCGTPITQSRVLTDCCSCFSCRSCVEKIRNINRTGLHSSRSTGSDRNTASMKKQVILLGQVRQKMVVGRFHLVTWNELVNERAERRKKSLTEGFWGCETSVVTIANVRAGFFRERMQIDRWSSRSSRTTHQESIHQLDQRCWRSSKRISPKKRALSIQLLFSSSFTHTSVDGPQRRVLI